LKARNAKYHADHQENIKAHKKQYRALNQEQIKEYGRKYHAENRERLKKVAKERYAANRQWYNAMSRKYYEENRERMMQYHRQKDRANRARNTANKRKYRAENPEKYKVYTQKRRSLKLHLPMDFDEHDWAYCLAYWNNRCAICGRAVGEGSGYTLAADHWIPLSDPRPDNPGTIPGNILPLCHGTSGCNNSKRNAEPLQWLIRYLGTTAAEQKLVEIMTYYNWLEAQHHDTNTDSFPTKLESDTY
jgi:hypothetical protein